MIDDRKKHTNFQTNYVFSVKKLSKIQNLIILQLSGIANVPKKFENKSFIFLELIEGKSQGDTRKYTLKNIPGSTNS